MVKTETTCPECGVEWDAIKADLDQRTPDGFIARMIVDNCTECQKHFNK